MSKDSWKYEFRKSAYSWSEGARDPLGCYITSILGLALRLEFT